MKTLIILSALLVSFSLAGLVREEPVEITDFETSEEMDAEDELSEEAFEEMFGEEPITDPEELERHRETLEREEAEVKEENKEFMEGKKDWFDRINEYSDLPKDEFEAERTGDFDSDQARYGRGLINPEVAPVDEASERYFDTVRSNRASAPASYSSVDMGYVTEVTIEQLAQCDLN